MQSNLVTYGRYKFSSWQINCLVNIVDKLQPAMTTDISWLTADFDEFRKHLNLSKDGTLEIEIAQMMLKEIDMGLRYLTKLRNFSIKMCITLILMKRGKYFIERVFNSNYGFE